MTDRLLVKVPALAAAAIVALSMLSDAYGAQRYHPHRSTQAIRAHRTQPPVVSPPVRSYGGGGYSSDPRTRALEILADRYRPREW